MFGDGKLLHALLIVCFKDQFLLVYGRFYQENRAKFPSIYLLDQF